VDAFVLILYRQKRFISFCVRFSVDYASSFSLSLIFLFCCPTGSRDATADPVKPELMAQLVENISAMTEAIRKKSAEAAKASASTSDDDDEEDDGSYDSYSSDDADDDDFE